MMKKLRVTQIRSGIGCPYNQRETLRRLGLKRTKQSHELADSASVRGMIYKVRHLVAVEELNG